MAEISTGATGEETDPKGESAPKSIKDAISRNIERILRKEKEGGKA